MTKQKQIHKGKIPLEPSPGHIDTKNRKFHITIYESTDTVLFCAFQKTPVLSKHPNIHRYL